MNILKKSQEIIESSHQKDQKIKELVSLVSQIPYKRIGSLEPKDMLDIGMGSCTPKHIFLAQCFSKLEIPTKFLIIAFYYSKLDINYPTRNDNLIESMPVSYHVALKVKIKNKWIIIDVTWDPKLKGFPINKNWDGFSDMLLAVTPEKIIEQEDDPREFEKQIGASYNDDENKARKDFYEFFDTILENARI